jgi:hypothetical protein
MNCERLIFLGKGEIEEKCDELAIIFVLSTNSVS